MKYKNIFCSCNCPLTKSEYDWVWSYFRHSLAIPHDYTGNDLNDIQKRIVQIFYKYHLDGDASDYEPFSMIQSEKEKMNLFYKIGNLKEEVV